MLTLGDFNEFDEESKIGAVLMGVFLGERNDNGLIVQLYGVADFYVEVYFNVLENKIQPYRAFDSPSLLLPYLAHIKFNYRN